LGLRVTGMGSDAAAPGLISFWLRLPARIRVGISFARQMAWEGCSRRSHRDVIGIRLYGNRPETRTSPANTGPSRRRKRKSKLVPGERALQALPDRGCNQWPKHLSGMPRTVSMASIVWKVVDPQIRYLHFSLRVSNTAANFCPSAEFGPTSSSPSTILTYSGPICRPRASALAASASTALVSFPSSAFII
jgi:hypothetical protein